MVKDDYRNDTKCEGESLRLGVKWNRASGGR